MANPIIPPGGFIAFGSNTQATQALLRRNGATRKKRAKKKTATKRARPKKKRAKKSRAMPAKGSAAMKRKMAKLRAMRKK